MAHKQPMSLRELNQADAVEALVRAAGEDAMRRGRISSLKVREGCKLPEVGATQARHQAGHRHDTGADA
jgi:hypothetical protein